MEKAASLWRWEANWNSEMRDSRVPREEKHEKNSRHQTTAWCMCAVSDCSRHIFVFNTQLHFISDGPTVARARAATRPAMSHTSAILAVVRLWYDDNHSPDLLLTTFLNLCSYMNLNPTSDFNICLFDFENFSLPLFADYCSHYKQSLYAGRKLVCALQLVSYHVF